MNYLRLAAVSLLLLCSQLTFADSIKTYVVTQISMQMFPDPGTGEQILFSFSGPQVSFSGEAGMFCPDWCSDQPIFGTPVVSPSMIFIAAFNDPAIVGGIPYSASGGQFGFDGNPGLFNDSGGVSRFITGFTGEGDTFTQFHLILPQNGTWVASFTFVPPDGTNPGYYNFNGATFTATAPEPGTIALALTGLAGIAGLVRKKYPNT
jgi:hypothetical protein